MFRKILLFAFVILFLGACTEDQEVIKATGGVRYGGTFRFMSSEKVNNLFPLEISDAYSVRITNQIFEGLLRINPESTELMPSIAKEAEVNENSTVFRFTLRDDVYFQDDNCFKNGKGRKVTAEDIKYVLEFACSDNEMNHMSHLLIDKIKGAEEYYAGNSNNVSGIIIENDHTIVIELVSPFSGFKKILTHPGLSIFPQEAFEHYGEDIRTNPVGTGAFILEKLAEDEIVLKRNDNYYRKDEFGNPLPFLDKVVMTYSKNKTDELLSFREEKIDLVLDIPVEEVKNVLGSLSEAKDGKNVKHIVDSKSSMSITYYGFANQHEVFSKKEVRQAFNMAIDRRAIIDNWLEGEGWAVTHGFVPKMEGYPYEEVKGYSYNVSKAKQLMADAGYPDGKGFPTVTIYVNALEASGGHKLAQAVQHSLKENLNVDIEIELVTINEREEAINSGVASFWRSAWIADYPDPENFLNLFYSKNIDGPNNYLNQFKYESEEFDKTFEQALRETDEVKRMELLAKCDQIIIDDAVIMPILTDDFITMVNLKVKKFVTNEVEMLDFSHIYIRETK